MEWIKCSDRLPNDIQDCWIYDDNEQIYNACYGNNCFYTDNYTINIESVTHWMPYYKPEPPKDD